MSLALGVCVLTAVAGSAHAAIVPYECHMNGAQVVGPVATPAIGVAFLTFNTTTSELSIASAVYQDLLGPSVNVSLQGPALPNQNGGAFFFFTLDNPGATSGSFSGSTVLTGPQVTALENGMLYILLRSQVFTGGEIRGHVLQVPAPGAAALLGLAALAGARRRR